MQDRPTSLEILAAVRGFLETDVVPAMDARKRFHARVAINLLSIVGREWGAGDAPLLAEWRRLDALIGNDSPPANREALETALRGRNERLCARIRNGEADTGKRRQSVVEHVRRTVIEKLEIANPRFLAGEQVSPEESHERR